MGAASIFTDHADSYAAHADRSPVNCAYDRPTVLRLAGELAGKRVLELGCAAGGLTARLAERGPADLLAVDAEPRMVELARRRLGDTVRLGVVDLAGPRPLAAVPTGGVDVAVASLVLHYLKDWAPLLADLRRCLVPGGVLVFSVHHPITGWLLSDRTDYHRVELVSETWDFDGLAVTARSYRRPLSSIFGALLGAGFVIDAVCEPTVAAGDGISPELLGALNTQPFFLFVRAVSAAGR